MFYPPRQQFPNAMSLSNPVQLKMSLVQVVVRPHNAFIQNQLHCAAIRWNPKHSLLEAAVPE
jgi:hypothetical protein